MGRADGGSADGVGAVPTAFRPSRRAILRGGLSAAGAGLLTVGGRAGPVAGVTAPYTLPAAPPAEVVVCPRPGTRTASPGTEITFRGLTVEELGTVEVVGRQTGAHSGILAAHADGHGASFLPDAPFQPGESVTVRAGVPLGAIADDVITFTVATPAPPPRVDERRNEESRETAEQSFRTRPDLRPPVIEVTTPAAETAPGLVFVGAKSPRGQNGAMILDQDGHLVWFSPQAGAVDTVGDVRVQRYLGQPVITWWEGVSQRGHGLGHFVIRDSSYREIVTLRAGNGYPGGDQHEFLLTPQGSALIVVYNPVRWDLSSVGGAKDGVALDSIVQEIEVATGRVLFEWHSLDHLGLDESYSALPENAGVAYDYAHVNAIEIDHDGNLIVCARNTHAVYKVDYRTGQVLWRLNGKRGDFDLGTGAGTAFHHDARVQPNGELTIFDNATDSNETGIPSRGVVLDLDPEGMTARLAREFVHPTEIASVSQGNMQQLPNGNVFIGWGSAPVFSEFGPDGSLRFNGRFPTTVTSYRAYRFPWIGLPSDPPAVVAEPGAGDEVTVYVSWNGATEVATWEVLAGSDPARLRPIKTAPRDDFETAIAVRTSEPFLAVQGVDATGHVLGLSAVVEPRAEASASS